MKKYKDSIEYKLRNSKMYQGKGKYYEQPLNTLWTETMVFDQSEEFKYKVVDEIED